MRFVHFWCCSFAYLFLVYKSYGQRASQYQAEVGAIVASDQTPFWLRANQYGTVPLKNPFGRFKFGIRSDYVLADSTGYQPKMDWGYGLDVVANGGPTSQFLIPQAYIKG